MSNDGQIADIVSFVARYLSCVRGSTMEDRTAYRSVYRRMNIAFPPPRTMHCTCKAGWLANGSLHAVRRRSRRNKRLGMHRNAYDHEYQSDPHQTLHYVDTIAAILLNAHLKGTVSFEHIRKNGTALVCKPLLQSKHTITISQPQLSMFPPLFVFSSIAAAAVGWLCLRLL